MSEAITGVPDANASVSTIPKLSPASDGAQSTSASCSRRHNSEPPIVPNASMRSSAAGSPR